MVHTTKKQIYNLISEGQGSFNAVKTLLEENMKEVNFNSVDGNTSLLGRAAHFGNIELVKLLVEKYNVPVNPLKGEVMSPFERAIHFGHYDVAEYLHEKGASAKYLSVESKLKFAIHLGANEYQIMDAVVRIHELKNPNLFEVNKNWKN